MISSSQFRQQNKVFFSCPINHRESEKTIDGYGYPILTPSADYLDINKNGQLDFRLGGSRYDTLVAKEPCLKQSLSQLSDLAKTMETEVLTQEDVKGVEYGYPARTYFRNPQPKTPVTSLDNLDLGGAMPRDGQWAIDVEKHEFLLYRKA